jgi:formamidopyrimidine-DNA glycosylase
MPELPEVETVRRGLEQKVLGKIIKNVKVLRPQTIIQSFDSQSPGEASPNVSGDKTSSQSQKSLVQGFEKALKGQSFDSISRRAKYLFLTMHNGLTAITHLKMSGAFVHQKSTEEAPIHARVLFELDDGFNLFFKDLRAFGRMHLCKSLEEALELDSIASLAPEPAHPAFTVDYFTQKLSRSNSAIKALLLNQNKIVSGIGNIYADESLFISGILPSRPANQITAPEAKKLHAAIQKVISESIELGGSSIRDYVKLDESLGQYALNLFVYGRKKQNCKVCSTPITYTKLAQRGTHFCPACQK